jgi:hypothetical protein
VTEANSPDEQRSGSRRLMLTAAWACTFIAAAGVLVMMFLIPQADDQSGRNPGPAPPPVADSQPEPNDPVVKR